jgi:mannose-1-phosphate guanylyltransferase
VRDEEAFLAGLRAAAEAARTHDAFVTLGIPPTRAETGFGYMEVDEEETLNSVQRVLRFIEKPDLARAEQFLASGRFYWNAGIFVFRTSLLFEELSKTSPEILNIARRAHAARKAAAPSTFEEDPSSSSFTEIFSSSPSVSFDVAVMEKARHVLTVPCACGWSDLGSWDAVFEFRGGAPGRNVLEGPATCVEGSGNLVLAEGRPVRVVGLSDVAVVDSKDGVLVMRRDASDSLRRSVEEDLSR